MPAEKAMSKKLFYIAFAVYEKTVCRKAKYFCKKAIIEAIIRRKKEK